MFKITCLLIILFLSTFAHGKEEIRFGVFAYLGYEKTKEKYEPLIEYLNTKLDKKVILEVLTQEEMDLKIKNKELDIATTNPIHFLNYIIYILKIILLNILISKDYYSTKKISQKSTSIFNTLMLKEEFTAKS